MGSGVSTLMYLPGCPCISIHWHSTSDHTLQQQTRGCSAGNSISACTERSRKIQHTYEEWLAITAEQQRYFKQDRQSDSSRVRQHLSTDTESNCNYVQAGQAALVHGKWKSVPVRIAIDSCSEVNFISHCDLCDVRVISEQETNEMIVQEDWSFCGFQPINNRSSTDTWTRSLNGFLNSPAGLISITGRRAPSETYSFGFMCTLLHRMKKLISHALTSHVRRVRTSRRPYLFDVPIASTTNPLRALPSRASVMFPMVTLTLRVPRYDFLPCHHNHCDEGSTSFSILILLSRGAWELVIVGDQRNRSKMWRYASRPKSNIAKSTIGTKEMQTTSELKMCTSARLIKSTDVRTEAAAVKSVITLPACFCPATQQSARSSSH